MNNFFRLFCCCTFLLISILLPGQKETTFQQVLLKDGNIIRGEIISDNADKVSIQTLSGAVFHIERQYIKKVIQITTDQKLLPNGKTINNGNLYTNAFWGVLLGKEDTWRGEENTFGYTILHFSLGHRFNPYLSVGAGMSWDQYDITLFSFFGEVSGDLVQQTVSPYYAFRAGYGLPLFNDTPEENYTLGGGYMIHPAIGLRFASAQRTNVMLELGYRFQQFQREYDDFLETKDRITNRRLAIRLGLDF